jgi:NAD+ synthase
MFPVKQAFDVHALDIDASAETNRIVSFLRDKVRNTLHRRGLVVGVSGGVDSAVVLSLAVRAVGPSKVVALLLPERDSDSSSENLARLLTSLLGVETIREEITGALEGFGCYARRDAAIRRVVPTYHAEAGYRAKIVLPDDLLDADTLNLFHLIVVAPDGHQIATPLPPKEFLEIVAASNLKQRTRMSFLYYHAETRNYAVAGTPNRNEHMQGFFVKHGDGGTDINPIIHLYKTQVYQLAKFLDVPKEIYERTPTTDTYSAPCSQQEFFFRLPFEQFDLVAMAQDRGIASEQVAEATGLTPGQIRRAIRDMTHKHQSTQYLRMGPLCLSQDDVARPEFAQ